MAKAYLLAIDGCTLAALQAAVRRFIRGEVDDHNGKFAPTTAELARIVRYEEFRAKAEAEHAQRFLSRPEPDPEPHFSEEEMERRRQQVNALLGRTKLKAMDRSAA